jgi:hypothetical protein
MTSNPSRVRKWEIGNVDLVVAGGNVPRGDLIVLAHVKWDNGRIQPPDTSVDGRLQ